METQLRIAFRFLIDEYKFTFVKHVRVRWDSFNHLYERGPIKIKVIFEAPSYIETKTRTTMMKDWMLWSKDDNDIVTLLKEIDHDYYESIITEVRSINRAMYRSITDKKRDELFKRYIDLEVTAVRRYLEYLKASNGIV